MKHKNLWWKVSHVIVFIYLLFILWGQYSLLDTVFPSLPIGIGLIILVAVLTHFLLRWCAAWKLHLDVETPSEKELIRLAALSFGVSFTILMLFYYAKFPGVFCVDAIDALQMCLTGEYSDWHPFIFVFLAYTIPVKLGGAWLVVPMQIFWYSVILAYMVCSLRYYRCPRKICMFILCYLMMVPDATYILLIPIKDSTFTIMTMLLFTELLHIVKTKGRWLEKKYNLVFVIANLVITTLIRHNGILFTLPMLVAILCFSKTDIKRCIAIVISVVVLLFTIKVPVYGAFNVEKPGHRKAELVGLCVNIMANAIIDSPEMVSDEVLDFFCGIQAEDVWKKLYRLGDWNNVKGLEENRTFNVLDNTSVSDILRYTVDTVIRCPDQCLKAALAVTGMVWQVDGERRWDWVYRKYNTIRDAKDTDDVEDPVYSVLKSYEIDLPGGDYITDVREQYTEMVQDGVLQYIFCYVGLLNLILLLVLFSRQENMVQAFLYTLPVLLYSYGTMLFLVTYDKRFFYYTYGCFFVIMFLLLGRDRKHDGLPAAGPDINDANPDMDKASPT